jgi:hypothetical protein
MLVTYEIITYEVISFKVITYDVIITYEAKRMKLVKKNLVNDCYVQWKPSTVEACKGRGRLNQITFFRNLGLVLSNLSPSLTYPNLGQLT